MTTIIMEQQPCDRCGKVADLRPYHSSVVVFRGKTLEKPWLCAGCFRIEKRKAWAVA